VLVADDQAPLRLLCRITLEYEGLIVLEARDGIEALELARRERPDLVLLDLMMPGLDGWQVAAALRAGEATSRIPIIFLSAHAEPAEQSRGLDSGGIDYITKPFDAIGLAAMIRKLLGRIDQGGSEEVRAAALNRVRALASGRLNPGDRPTARASDSGRTAHMHTS